MQEKPEGRYWPKAAESISSSRCCSSRCSFCCGSSATWVDGWVMFMVGTSVGRDRRPCSWRSADAFGLVLQALARAAVDPHPLLGGAPTPVGQPPT